MARRDERVRKVLREYAEQTKALQERAVEQIPDLTIGEVLHADQEGQPHEIFVVAKFVNRRRTADSPPVTLRCFTCQETLSQASVASWPALIHRPDGSTYSAVLVTCTDEECGQRLKEKLRTEGP